MTKYSLDSNQYTAKQFRVHKHLSCRVLYVSYALAQPLFNEHKVFLREETLYLLLWLQLLVPFVLDSLINRRRLLLVISCFDLLGLLDFLVESSQMGHYFFRFLQSLLLILSLT